ncbi:MAG TPA: hypothetical protein VGD59_14550 [Acidisarcina sp.]
MNGLPTSLVRETISCEEFQEKLPELFESGRPLDSEEHLKTCKQCAALVSDLQYIAVQAKLLLPLHDPSPAVWEKIEAKLNE